jgi:hypothetical protein
MRQPESKESGTARSSEKTGTGSAEERQQRAVEAAEMLGFNEARGSEFLAFCAGFRYADLTAFQGREQVLREALGDIKDRAAAALEHKKPGEIG